MQLVGAGGADWIAPIKGEPGVTVHGAIDDLTALYSEAAITIVPLRAGGGSRLKILEAFTNRLPVVASHDAARGLDVTDGKELVLAVDDDEFASAALRILVEPASVDAMIANARRFVTEHH